MWFLGYCKFGIVFYLWENVLNFFIVFRVWILFYFLFFAWKYFFMIYIFFFVDFLGCIRWGLISFRLSLLYNFLLLIKFCENFFIVIFILRFLYIFRYFLSFVFDMIGNLMWLRTLNIDNFLFCGLCSSYFSVVWRIFFFEDIYNCLFCRSFTIRFFVNFRYFFFWDVDIKCLWINVFVLFFSFE